MSERVNKDAMACNKPRRTPGHAKKSHVVKACFDGKEKLIRFGEQGASTAGKLKAGESERMKTKRASFKSRHAKNIAKGKSSAAYWADRVKWNEGGMVKMAAGGSAALALIEQMRRSAAQSPEFDPVQVAMREQRARPARRPAPQAAPRMPEPQAAQPREAPLPLPPVPPAMRPDENLPPEAPRNPMRFDEGNPHVATAIRMAEKYNLPRDIFLSLVQQESGFNPAAVSRRGAIGLGQLMPGTAQELRVDPRDPEQNLEGSARYLRQMLDRFKDMPLALAAYNAGPGRVARAGNTIPNIRETREYVPSILRRAGANVPEGYAEGGRVVDWDRYLPRDLPESAFSEQGQSLSYRPLNVRRLLDAGAIRVTDPSGDPSGEGWSLVSRWNDVFPESITPQWADRPEARASAINVLNQPGPLYDGKYRQILWSARELGLRPEEVFLPESESGRGLADLEQKYAEGGAVAAYDPEAVEALVRSIEEPEGYAEGGLAQLEQKYAEGGRVRRTLRDELRDIEAEIRGERPASLGVTVARGFGEGASGIVSPATARAIQMTTRLPQDERFLRAVEGTPGARITDDGLELEVLRYQKPEQAGAQAIREGVFYLPAASDRFAARAYRGTDTAAYGGPEMVRGETLLRAPLAVPGPTGGAVPERAYRELTSDADLKKLISESRSVAHSRYLGPDYRLAVEDFLDTYGGNPDIAAEIINASRVGNRMRYALQENIIGNRARREGYDSIVGTGARAPRISEVFDLREAAYPVPGVPEMEMLLPQYEMMMRRYAEGGLAQLEQKYAEGGEVSAMPYNPDAVDALVKEIEAEYV